MEIWQSLSEHWCKIMAMEYCSVRLSKMLFSHNEGSYGTGATDDDMIKKEKKKKQQRWWGHRKTSDLRVSHSIVAEEKVLGGSSQKELTLER